MTLKKIVFINAACCILNDKKALKIAGPLTWNIKKPFGFRVNFQSVIFKSKSLKHKICFYEIFKHLPK